MCLERLGRGGREQRRDVFVALALLDRESRHRDVE